MASFNIKDHPDRDLQERVNEYFAAFADQDVPRLMRCLTEDFVMDDYRKYFHCRYYPRPSCLEGVLILLCSTSCNNNSKSNSCGSRSLPALGILGLKRADFQQSCERQFAGTTDIHMGCLSLQGTSEEDGFAALEWMMSFQLNVEIPALAPGVKAGERVTMVGVSLLWWGPDGKIKRQAEHGRPMWNPFDVELARRMV